MTGRVTSITKACATTLHNYLVMNRYFGEKNSYCSYISIDKHAQHNGEWREIVKHDPS